MNYLTNRDREVQPAVERLCYMASDILTDEQLSQQWVTPIGSSSIRELMSVALHEPSRTLPTMLRMLTRSLTDSQLQSFDSGTKIASAMRKGWAAMQPAI